MKSSIVVFLKAQISAFLGGLFDYLIMIALTEWGGLFYTYSIAISGVLGAVVNFSINRYWTFGAAKMPTSKQLPKFVAVVIGSIVLKSSGTYLLSEGISLDYKISRLIIDFFVSLGFNFTLQKYWVFTDTKKATH